MFYQLNLQQGVLVNVLNPQIEGSLRATNTALISTIESLVPNAIKSVINLALPHSLEVVSFRYFQFVTTSLRILSATASENTSPGIFCDAQTVLQNFRCLAVASERHWALTLVIDCDALASLEDVDNVTKTSNANKDLFVTSQRQRLSPNSTDFDLFNMDTAIVDMCTCINAKGGFIIKGWFKSSMTEEGARRCGTHRYLPTEKHQCSHRRKKQL